MEEMLTDLPLVIIYRNTTPAGLVAEAASIEPPFAIQGKGARAQRLLMYLDKERSDLRVGRFGDDWVALVGDHPQPFGFAAPGA